MNTRTFSDFLKLVYTQLQGKPGMTLGYFKTIIVQNSRNLLKDKVPPLIARSVTDPKTRDVSFRSKKAGVSNNVVLRSADAIKNKSKKRSSK